MPRSVRFMLVALGITVLIAGTWGGLVRLGSPLPTGLAPAIPHHGVLMIGGFLGTLITLERAVAIGSWWCFLGPLAAGSGAWVILAGGDVTAGAALITIASVVLLVDFGVILRRQLTNFTVVMTLGAVAWLIGNVLWLAGWPVAHLVPWWSAFLVLTIVGERLELSRFMPERPGRQPRFIAATAVYGLGLVLSAMLPGLGLLVMGAGLVALAAWLGVYDVARQTIRQHGLPGFVAAALLSGYVWMALAGVLAVWYAVFTPGTSDAGWMSTIPMGGSGYDALWHALLLGFVFGMIFGHAPIIFPAVLNVHMRFSRLFYIHLTLLQLTLLMRIVGDLAGMPPLKGHGGLGNALAIGLFLVMTLTSVRRPTPPTPEGEPDRREPNEQSHHPQVVQLD